VRIGNAGVESATDALRAYQALKKRILNGTYAPGERLSEVRLAEELGLGRSPIRTALGRLKNDGWISVSPKSGTYVRSLSDREIAELLELRLLLETHVARTAARSIGDDDLGKLRRAFEQLRPLRSAASPARLRAAFMDFDSMLHMTLYRAAGNTMITGILMNLIDKIQWIRTSAPTPQHRVDAALDELQRLIEALEARNARAAADRMDDHIRNAAEHAARTRSGGTADGAAIADAVASTRST